MEIRTLNCNCCGAPLERLDAEGFYACSHCDAVHATFEDLASISGPKIDRIDRTTQQIAECLEGIDLAHRAECRHYLVRTPSVARRWNAKEALTCAVIFCSVGILFCMIGVMVSGVAFLGGMAFLALGMAIAIFDHRAVQKERWERLIARYHKRPQSVDAVRRLRLD